MKTSHQLSLRPTAPDSSPTKTFASSPSGSALQGEGSWRHHGSHRAGACPGLGVVGLVSFSCPASPEHQRPDRGRLPGRQGPTRGLVPACLDSTPPPPCPAQPGKAPHGRGRCRVQGPQILAVAPVGLSPGGQLWFQRAPKAPRPPSDPPLYKGGMASGSHQGTKGKPQNWRMRGDPWLEEEGRGPPRDEGKRGPLLPGWCSFRGPLTPALDPQQPPASSLDPTLSFWQSQTWCLPPPMRKGDSLLGQGTPRDSCAFSFSWGAQGWPSKLVPGCRPQKGHTHW